MYHQTYYFILTLQLNSFTKQILPAGIDSNYIPPYEYNYKYQIRFSQSPSIPSWDQIPELTFDFTIAVLTLGQSLLTIEFLTTLPLPLPLLLSRKNERGIRGSNFVIALVIK